MQLRKYRSKRKREKKTKAGEVDDENITDQTAVEDEEQSSPFFISITFDPGAAYFISYAPNEFCNEDIIYTLLHENDMDCEVNKISTRRPKDFEDENSMLQLKLS